MHTIEMSKTRLKSNIFFRCTEEEKAILQAYCERSQRSHTDVMREFVRSLESKNVQPEDNTKA